MNNLAIIIEQIKDEIEVDTLGKGKASVRAVSRLVDVQHSSISKALTSGALKPSKIAEILIEQGFEGGALASWKSEGIPDIALALIAHYYAYEAGRYCTTRAKLVCKAFAAIGIRVWIQSIKGWSKEDVATSKPALLPTPTVDEIAQLIDLTLGKTDLDKNLVAGVKLNAIARQHPQLALAAETAKSALLIEVESNLLTPTAVGEKLTVDGKTWTSQQVNKVLIELGLQEKNPAGKNPSYLPTEKGKEYGCLVLDTAKGHGKTVQHLRWYPSVVEVLNENNEG